MKSDSNVSEARNVGERSAASVRRQCGVGERSAASVHGAKGGRAEKGALSTNIHDENVEKDGEGEKHEIEFDAGVVGGKEMGGAANVNIGNFNTDARVNGGKGGNEMRPSMGDESHKEEEEEEESDFESVSQVMGVRHPVWRT